MPNPFPNHPADRHFPHSASGRPDSDPLGPGRSQSPEFGRLISQKIVSEGETFYHHYDALGSTAALTDSSGVVTDEYDYKAFGETAASTGATPNPFQWVAQVGYRKDETTDLYHLRRRDYDTSSGRFSSEDVVRDDEENLYRYVGNDPVRKTDPSGLEIEFGQHSLHFFITEGAIPVGFLRELGSIKRLAILEQLPGSVLDKLENKAKDRFVTPKDPEKSISAMRRVLREEVAEFTWDEFVDAQLEKAWSLVKAYSSTPFEPGDSAFHYSNVDEEGSRRISLSAQTSDTLIDGEVFNLYVRTDLKDLTVEDLKEYIELEQ